MQHGAKVNINSTLINMRNIKQLLNIVLDNIELIGCKEYYSSLCLLIVVLEENQTITNSEWEKLNTYFIEHAPYKEAFYKDTFYWWKPGLVEPRRDWIINELKFH